MDYMFKAEFMRDDLVEVLTDKGLEILLDENKAKIKRLVEQNNAIEKEMEERRKK